MKTETQKYPAYKHSGVEWLGEIPSHWEVKRLRTISEVINGATPSSNIESYWDGDIIWVTPAEINNLFYINDSVRKITKAGYKNCGTTVVPKGSVILTCRAPIGKVVIAAKELCTNQGCKSLVLKDNNSEFIYFQLLIRKEELNSLGTGTTFMELGNEKLKNLQVIIPPLPEQTAIAAFLDRKTALIDQAIGIKQKQIALLKERRQILIHKAVTRGLNPHVKLKDSGVEWIGEIPEGWEVKKVKHFGNIKSGESVVNSLLNDSGQYEVYGGNGNMGFYNKFNVEGRKIIIGRVGAYCGNVRLIDEKKWISDNALILTLSDESNYSYLAILLEIGNLNNLNSSNAQPLITGSKVLNFQLPIPSINEQIKIHVFISQIKIKIATAISLKEQEIEKLKEYKATLINSAVTGKMKVV